MGHCQDVTYLVDRLKNDAQDFEGISPHSHGLIDYLKQILKDGNLTHEVAIGSAKKAISNGIDTLTEPQLKSIAIDMLNNEVYMPACPNEWCGEKISWEDMEIALWEGQCSSCNYREEKIMNE